MGPSQLRGSNVIVSTGTRPAMDAVPGLAEAQPLTRASELRHDLESVLSGISDAQETQLRATAA